MDIDKLIALLKAFGFPVVVALWFMLKLQAFLETLVTQQAAMIEILNRLVAIHK